MRSTKSMNLIFVRGRIITRNNFSLEIYSLKLLYSKSFTIRDLKGDTVVVREDTDYNIFAFVQIEVVIT